MFRNAGPRFHLDVRTTDSKAQNERELDPNTYNSRFPCSKRFMVPAHTSPFFGDVTLTRPCKGRSLGSRCRHCMIGMTLRQSIRSCLGIENCSRATKENKWERLHTLHWLSSESSTLPCKKHGLDVLGRYSGDAGFDPPTARVCRKRKPIS